MIENTKRKKSNKTNRKIN